MFLKQVLIQAMDLGKMMLISGAGVSRVEDTIERICLAYGAREVEAFTITSSIVVTVTTEDGDVFTQTKRIKYYKTDFHKLDRLNDLSRYVCREKPDITYLEEKLSDIRQEHIYSLPVQCLIASLIAGTFAVFFGGGFVEGIIGAVCGAAVWRLMAFLQKLDSNIMFSDFAAAFMVGTTGASGGYQRLRHDHHRKYNASCARGGFCQFYPGYYRRRRDGRYDTAL